MPQILPIEPGADCRFETALGGREYVIECHWNERAEAWFLDVSESGGETVFIGAKVVLGSILGRTAPVALAEAGVLVAYDTSRTNVDAGPNDLGARVLVLYFTGAEWAAELRATGVP